MNDNGKKDLAIYTITHLDTGEKVTVLTNDTHSACVKEGWLPENCYIARVAAIPADDDALARFVRVLLPCEVCSFQWAECKKPPLGECPSSPQVPDATEWLIEVTKAHLCPWAGIDLRHNDYRLHQKWVDIRDAVKELTTKQR